MAKTYRFTVTVEVQDEAKLLEAARELAGPEGGDIRTVEQALGEVLVNVKDGLELADLGCEVLELTAEQDGRDDARLAGLVERLLELAGEDQEVQDAVDDLIYDHCGTGKKWSNVNNQGIAAQADALVEGLGLEITLKELGGVLRAHGGQE